METSFQLDYIGNPRKAKLLPKIFYTEKNLE